MTDERHHVLVVDDDAALLSGLARGLAYEGFSVGTATNGANALAAARDFAPDLVVLDIMMPGLDGLEVCRRLKEGDPATLVLLLTARDAATDEVRGLTAGADDYVVKPFDFEVLLARVRALLRRRESTARRAIVFQDLKLDTAGRLAYRGERRIDLTTTEYELLQHLMSNPGRVLGKDLLMERVWGYDFGGNPNILEVYVAALRRKLEADDEPRLIQTVRGAGYVLRER